MPVGSSTNINNVLVPDRAVQHTYEAFKTLLGFTGNAMN